MLCEIHYFITTLKTKIDVIILSRFNYFLGQSHPQLGITNSPDFKFHYFSWFSTFKFPKITLFKSSKQLRQNVKCFFGIISMFKITFLKLPYRSCNVFSWDKVTPRGYYFGPALKSKKKCERIVTSNYNLFFYN